MTYIHSYIQTYAHTYIHTYVREGLYMHTVHADGHTGRQRRTFGDSRPLADGRSRPPAERTRGEGLPFTPSPPQFEAVPLPHRTRSSSPVPVQRSPCAGSKRHGGGFTLVPHSGWSERPATPSSEHSQPTSVDTTCTNCAPRRRMLDFVGVLR